MERRTIIVSPVVSLAVRLVAGGHAVIAGHTQRVLQLVGGLCLLDGIIRLPRSHETSPRHPDPFQRRLREPGHAATPVH
ncbi:hypothetical protein MTF65_03130 [Streptomyces sp. APSN-46.1]|uniref:hypothetical protein n=1 Tax=Streptomyces sp. APSN-46.1 TaxID=2929049 RepID=UPI001FB4BDD9|nr:hypothetical protein [Streptomyces sp. APSN-46.1]MCJ1676360.1 hypothetical protein [Streptomyces sp. APSN-46.1]